VYLEELRERVGSDLKSAMKLRSSLDVRALRSLLTALDNGTAVALESLSPEARRAGEVPRRELTSADVEAILQRQVDEREDAAAEYARLGMQPEVERLRAEIAILNRYLGAKG
jgi:uncharacterized protein